MQIKRNMLFLNPQFENQFLAQNLTKLYLPFQTKAFFLEITFINSLEVKYFNCAYSSKVLLRINLEKSSVPCMVLQYY